MKKNFLIAISILTLVLVQNLAQAQTTDTSANSEAVQRTQLSTATSPSFDLSATSVSAPTPAVSYNKKIADNADFDTYMHYLQRRVQLKWYPPVFDKSKRTVASFSIAKNGKVFDTKIVKSSGDIIYDGSVLDVIANSTPLIPLPSDVKQNYVEIQFVFDSAPTGLNCHGLSSYGKDANNFITVSNGPSSASVYNSYQDQVDNVIVYNTPQKQYFFPKRAAVILGLDKNGSVKYVNFVKKPRHKQYGESIVSALTSAEFPPIPASLNEENMEFTYNLVSPPYSHKNKNIFKCGAAYVARCLTIIRTGY